MAEKKRIILDTNFIMIPAQFGLDIFTELQKTVEHSYKLLIFDKSLEELKNVAEKQKGVQKESVKITISLIQNMKNNSKLNIIPAKTRYIDKEILEIAEKDAENTIVATQDAELRSKLKERGVKTIFMRQKKYLVEE